MEKPLLEASHIRMIFDDSSGKVPVLDDVSMSIYPHEFVSIIGPSGCGKSTLLRILCGLLEPTGGELIYPAGKEPDPRAIVFQNSNLMPWLRTGENIALPLIIKGVPKDQAMAEAAEWMDMMGIGGFSDTWPKSLSGGMAQRAAIARALIQKPELLLMDEPFGSLDAITREQISLELMSYRERISATVLMVTHSIPEALLLSDRVLVFSDRPTHIVEDIRVPFPRPRDPNLQDDPEFLALSRELRGKIRNKK